jgi:hypothetical protein
MKLLIPLAVALVSTAGATQTTSAHQPTSTPSTFQYLIAQGSALQPELTFKGIKLWEHTKQKGREAKEAVDKLVTSAQTEEIKCWFEERAKNIKMPDLSGANEWIRGVAAEIQQAINNQEDSKVADWLKTATEKTGVNATLEDLQAIKLEDLPQEILDWIKANPGQTAFYVVGGVAFFAPGLLYGPLLNLVGFGAGGVRRGSMAAAMQRMFGAAVPAGSLFATSTSAAAGGYGVAAWNGAFRAGALRGIARRAVRSPKL